MAKKKNRDGVFNMNMKKRTVKIECRIGDRDRCPQKLHRLTMSGMRERYNPFKLTCSILHRGGDEKFVESKVDMAEDVYNQYAEEIESYLWSVLENYDSYG